MCVGGGAPPSSKAGRKCPLGQTLTTCSERCDPRAKPPADFAAAPTPRPRGARGCAAGAPAAVRPRSSAAKGAGAGAALPGAPGARWVLRDAPPGGRRAGPARPRPGAQGTGPPGRGRTEPRPEMAPVPASRGARRSRLGPCVYFASYFSISSQKTPGMAAHHPPGTEPAADTRRGAGSAHGPFGALYACSPITFQEKYRFVFPRAPLAQLKRLSFRCNLALLSLRRPPARPPPPAQGRPAERPPSSGQAEARGPRHVPGTTPRSPGAGGRARRPRGGPRARGPAGAQRT